MIYQTVVSKGTENIKTTVPVSNITQEFYRSNGTYAEGEYFNNKYLPIQKGDGIHALPWKWTEETYGPAEEEEIFQHRTWYPGFPQFGETTRTFKTDIRDLTTVPYGGLSLVHSVTAEQRELVNSTAILKAQASLNKSVMQLPLIWRERKMTLKTAQSYSKFILNNMITMQRKDVKKWLAALKRKTRPNQLRALANQIADRHLEFVFGVLPLIEEIQQLLDHLDEPFTTVRTGRGRHRNVVEKDVPPRVARITPYHDITIEDTYRADYSVRVNLRCDIRSKLLNDSSLLGFNPLYYWYDNTPLSFVVGWFSNFNTWIMSLDALQGLDYVTGSSSIKEVWTFERKCYPKDYTTVQFGTANEAKCLTTLTPTSASLTHFDRLVHSKFPPIQRLRFMDKTSFFTHAASVSLMIQRMVKESNRLSTQKAFRYKGPKVRNLPPIKYRKV